MADIQLADDRSGHYVYRHPGQGAYAVAELAGRPVLPAGSHCIGPIRSGPEAERIRYALSHNPPLEAHG